MIWDERYVRGTAVDRGMTSRTGYSGSTTIRATKQRRLRIRRRICGRTCHPSTGNGSVRCGLLASIPISAAAIRKTACPCHARLDARSRQGLWPEILGLSASTHLLIRRSIRSTSSTIAQGVCWLLSLQATQHKGVLRGATLQAFVLGRYCCDVAVVAKSEGSAKGNSRRPPSQHGAIGIAAAAGHDA